jgi:hypothetical protein
MAVGDPAEVKNFRLLGHDPRAAWGGGSLVEVKKGFAYVGAVGTSGYDGPEGFTVHDVSDPRRPRLVREVKAPPGVHMHKVRVVGEDLLYVNAERLKTEEGKRAKAGIYIYDIRRPAEIREAGFYPMPGDGPHRFGVDNGRCLAFFPNAAEGWRGRVIWTVDIRDPLKPEAVSVWGPPGMDLKQNLPYKEPDHPDRVWQAHGPPVIRGNRMFCGFWGGGMVIADVTDLAHPKFVSQLTWAPPFAGSTHTVWPVGEKPYAVVTDEGRARQNYPDSQFMWIMDIREETKPIPVATFMPDRERYINRGKRYGAHNILEHIPAEGPWANLVFLTYFNAGLRAVDVSDPFRPREVGHFVPACDFGQPCVQSNDIGRDDEGRLYLIDRNGAGMHILEYTG